ncbi:MAG: hypothetical protein ACI87H_000446, partial [Gammaproteobacteria bacterium]
QLLRSVFSSQESTADQLKQWLKPLNLSPTAQLPGSLSVASDILIYLSLPNHLAAAIEAFRNHLDAAGSAQAPAAEGFTNKDALLKLIQSFTLQQGGGPAATTIKAEGSDNTAALPNEINLLLEQVITEKVKQRATTMLLQESQLPHSSATAIPFIDQNQIKPLQVEIRQKNQPLDEQHQIWELRISFELGTLGEIACHLLLENFSLSASFYSEQSDTRDKIENAIPEFRQQLQSAGFQTLEIHSFRGKFARDNSDQSVPNHDALIDLKA